MPNRHLRTVGVTLMELLAVIAVIAVLAALLLPVLSQSKRKAHGAHSISRLRQLGQAATLYEQQFGDHPLRVIQLVDAGLVDRSMCETPQDATGAGMLNEYLRYCHQTGVLQQITEPAFKVSFIGPGDFGFTPRVFERDIADLPAVGWLVDLSESEREIPNVPRPLAMTGPYRRLLLDGAVVVRRHSLLDCPEGPCRSSRALFGDMKEYREPRE